MRTKSWMFWMDLVSKIGCSFSLHCRHCPLVAVTPFSTKGLRCFITACISSPDHGLFVHRLDETRKPEQLKKRLEDKKRCTCKDVLASRDVAVQNWQTNCVDKICVVINWLDLLKRKLDCFHYHDITCYVRTVCNTDNLMVCKDTVLWTFNDILDQTLSLALLNSQCMAHSEKKQCWGDTMVSKTIHTE